MGVFNDTLNVQPNIKFTDMNIWKLELKFYSPDHRTEINLVNDMDSHWPIVHYYHQFPILSE